jgi:hypothetical protein
LANPTTNYSFAMPTPTDLVTDLPADFEVFGQAVDTQMKTNADAATQKATLTTKGDIYAATGTSTPARLAVGANNLVLTADSSTATGLKWAAAGGGALKEEVFTSSNASWTIPAGVTQIWALAIGSGGGGGGAGTGGNVGGGGGGAGRVLETWITISGDTTLNITVPAGGAGGVGSGATGPKGSTGSAATIVGNTTSTTYATASGGGGGGGSSSTGGLAGASGGGEGSNGSSTQGGGGGFGAPASNVNAFPFAIATSTGGGANPTTAGITGFSGGSSSTGAAAGRGITIWGRNVGGGGQGSTTSAMATQFGSGARGNDVNGSAGTANTGAGGGGCNSSSLALTGGAGGSGLVVLRYVGA